MDSTPSFLLRQNGRTISQDRNIVFELFEPYDWKNDSDFQNGIKGILEPMKASGSEEDKITQTELNAEIFFLSTN